MSTYNLYNRNFYGFHLTTNHPRIAFHTQRCHDLVDNAAPTDDIMHYVCFGKLVNEVRDETNNYPDLVVTGDVTVYYRWGRNKQAALRTDQVHKPNSEQHYPNYPTSTTTYWNVLTRLTQSQIDAHCKQIQRYVPFTYELSKHVDYLLNRSVTFHFVNATVQQLYFVLNMFRRVYLIDYHNLFVLTRHDYLQSWFRQDYLKKFLFVDLFYPQCTDHIIRLHYYGPSPFSARLGYGEYNYFPVQSAQLPSSPNTSSTPLYLSKWVCHNQDVYVWPSFYGTLRDMWMLKHPDSDEDITTNTFALQYTVNDIPRSILGHMASIYDWIGKQFITQNNLTR